MFFPQCREKKRCSRCENNRSIPECLDCAGSHKTIEQKLGLDNIPFLEEEGKIQKYYIALILRLSKNTCIYL